MIEQERRGRPRWQSKPLIQVVESRVKVRTTSSDWKFRNWEAISRVALSISTSPCPSRPGFAR